MNFCLTAVLFWRFYEYLPHFYGGSAILSAAMVLTVLNGRHDPSARVTWLIIVMCSPVFGSLLYFMSAAMWATGS
jgi:cardiolipin synthase